MAGCAHTLRRAGLVDAGALADVQLATSLHAYAHIFPPDAPPPTHELLAERWWRHITMVGACAFAAEVDGEIVGCAAAHDRDSPERALGHLQGLYVLPERWGSGIGRALHGAVVERLARRGHAAITLWVLEENGAARTLYERWGWSLVDGARFTHPGLDVTEVCYRLDLEPTR